jgi:hypothetical protein
MNFCRYTRPPQLYAEYQMSHADLKLLLIASGSRHPPAPRRHGSCAPATDQIAGVPKGVSLGCATRKRRLRITGAQL